MPSHSTSPGDCGDASQHAWPANVGILAVEICFPSQYVDQSELEVFDGASEGKYTIGLGQHKMGFCTDREDINSLCLTVVEKLMRRYGVAYESVGRLEVGTETIIDKSKSCKTVLMQLFEESGNTDVEGVDTTNACYGGTAALFNTVNWIESSSWDGRYGLVVAADIAVYASGAARPTGGAGAVAMLVGTDAPLVLDRHTRSSHMRHAYDFYKPDLSSEYPVVDGKLSVSCYLSALDKCYQRYLGKLRRKHDNSHPHQANGRANGVKDGVSDSDTLTYSLDDVDAVLFHAPYCKLVQKSLARLCFMDFLQAPSRTKYPKDLEKFRDVEIEKTYFDRDLEKAFMNFSSVVFKEKTEPSLLLSRNVGNMYAPSLYSCLVSWIISQDVESLAGKKALMFSYGSGLASSMFSLTTSTNCSPGSALQTLHSNLFEVHKKLESRQKLSPEKFSEVMALRESTHHQAPYQPVGDIKSMFPSTWYLENVDEKHRRSYNRVPS